MSIRYGNSLNFSDFEQRVHDDLPRAELAGARIVFDEAVKGIGVGPPRGPNEAQDLEGRASLRETETGAEMRFPGPYADYLENRTYLRHPSGGHAKYLEIAMVNQKDAALGAAADELRKAINE